MRTSSSCLTSWPALDLCRRGSAVFLSLISIARKIPRSARNDKSATCHLVMNGLEGGEQFLGAVEE